ncbi:MAG TPA: CNNM domain-containing protein [Phycisphaerae bacterium]|nr:CNNM domain-containing protein [Phycisphaerae bacterium]
MIHNPTGYCLADFITLQTLHWLLIAGAASFGSVLFSGLETGLYSISRLRLQLRCWRKDPRAEQIERWQKNPTSVLTGLLIWQNVANFAVCAAITVLIDQEFSNPVVQLLIAAAVVTPLMFLFAELLPKDLFLVYADRWTYHLVRPLQWALAVIRIIPLLPLLLVLDKIAEWLLGTGRQIDASSSAVIRYAEESSASGLISDTQHDLIRRALRMAHVSVSDVMVPWDRVIGVPLGISKDGFRAIVRRFNVSRLPVFKPNTQEILGVVNVVDVLSNQDQTDLQRFLTTPITLLPNQTVRSAITLMQAARQTIGIVVNLQGKPIGLATMKDLVEELTGDMEG